MREVETERKFQDIAEDIISGIKEGVVEKVLDALQFEKMDQRSFPEAFRGFMERVNLTFTVVPNSIIRRLQSILSSKADVSSQVRRDLQERIEKLRAKGRNIMEEIERERAASVREFEREMAQDEVEKKLFSGKDNQTISPSFWTAEDTAEIQYNIEMPGINKDDITLEASPSGLILSAPKLRPETRGRFHGGETKFGVYVFQARNLPYTIDHKAIGARYANGVLTINVPKVTSSTKSQISIS